MVFITGLFVLDAPASALNNAGVRQSAGTENIVDVKQIRTREGAYPYVSAQAFRYWLRETLNALAAQGKITWRSSPIFREAKVAYTDANPIKYDDDDLFGYMRAQGKRKEAQESRQTDASRVTETPLSADITRVSPFRVSTLVSIAPVNITEDQGFMSRHEGDPVPHTHQFYHTTLKGLFSLDLHASGTFSYLNRTGFRNLDDVRMKEAEQQGLEHLPNESSYRLPPDERARRIAALFEGLALLEGGAKLTLHYTDVTPPFVIMAVTQGGNHIFNYILGADGRGNPQIQLDALKQILDVYEDTLLSPLYIGWANGYLDDQRTSLIRELQELQRNHPKLRWELDHPRRIFQKIAAEIRNPNNHAWLE